VTNPKTPHIVAMTNKKIEFTGLQDLNPIISENCREIFTTKQFEENMTMSAVITI
jgi:hypothetical protein